MTSPPRDRMTDIGATSREIWATRPARLPDDRVIAGVAAAIARRYALDPTLVRVVFAVSAIWGVGLLLYLVAWLVLPDAARPGRTPVLVAIVVVFVGIATVGAVASGSPEAIVGLLLVGALLFALHVNRADLGVPGPGGTTAAVALDPAATGAGAAGPGPVAPPLPPHPPRPPGPPVTAVTLAAALLAAGAALAAGLLGWVPLGVTPVAGAALAVVGLGLVAGAFLRTGRPLVLAALPLALVVVAAAAAPSAFSQRPGDLRGWWGDDDVPAGGTSRAVSDAVWTPGTAAEVAPAYRTGIGDVRLELLTLAPGPLVTTTVESGVGDVTVLVGPTADVTADCATGAGAVDCLGRGGPGRVVDVGPDGPGGPVVSVVARSGAGDVAVRRG